jgi:PH (Pleckstrin Homology) domain-containing protein
VADSTVPIRYSDASQESEEVQRAAAEVAKILTRNEEIYYIAMQNGMSLSSAPDYVVATSNRIIFVDARVMGQVKLVDRLWQDVKDSQVEQGMLSSAFEIIGVDDSVSRLGELDKEQAKRLYSICQQMDLDWREKRRVRGMEEERARAGGVYLGPGTDPSSADGDPAARLARARDMLAQGLISETEFETLKARIISTL